MVDKQNDYELKEQDFELQLQIFGSSGGKTRVSEQIVSYIPKSKTFVEPFAGGAAVYFKKEPSETEILNDKNSEIAFAYNFIRDITPEQLNRLKAMDWNSTKEKFFKLRDSIIPQDDVQRFYRFYYVLIYSYGLSSKTYGYFVKNKFHIEKRLAKLKERLKNTKIFNKDYLEVLKEYNTVDTFAYLDPPYPKEWAGPEGTKLFSAEDTQKLHDFLKNEFKGKFILSINSLDWIRKMFKDFNLYKILVPRTFKHGDEAKFELIISNYDLNGKKELGETGSGDIPSGLQPKWIYGKKKKKILDENKKEEEYEEMSTEELISDLKNYDPAKLENNTLRNDMRIVFAWYTLFKESDGGGIKFSLEDIVNAAKLIYAEIERRKAKKEMDQDWDPDNMTNYSKDLFNIISKGKITNEKLEELTEDIKKLEPIITQFKPAILIKDFISLVGSQVKHQEEHKPNDYDLHVRMDKDKIAEYLERAIKVRLYKMVDESLADNLHVFFGDSSGGHDTFVSMYDLVLVPSERKIVKMSIKNEDILMNPYFLMKPISPAFYDLDKLIKTLK